MKVALLTSLGDGLPSLCIPALAKESSVEIVAVIHSAGRVPSRAKALRRRLRKIIRIGIVGAVNGRRLNSVFRRDLRAALATPTVENAAVALSLPYFAVPHINSDATRKILRECDADLGISLGNSWIGESVFRIPRRGMINIHHEILPAYRGAQSVIWQLHNGSRTTGYTIHEIDSRIDTGRILYSESMGIDLRPTLRETVCATTAKLQRESITGLLHTLQNLDYLTAHGVPQGPGTSYTTPTFRQFLHMRRQHKKLYRPSRSTVVT